MNRHSRALLAAMFALLVLAGCATAPTPPGPAPEAVRADIVRRMPARIDDRAGWAADIQTAFASQGIDPI